MDKYPDPDDSKSQIRPDPDPDPPHCFKYLDFLQKKTLRKANKTANTRLIIMMTAYTGKLNKL